MTPLEALETHGALLKVVGGTTPVSVHTRECRQLRSADSTATIEHRGALPLSAQLCPFCDPDAAVGVGQAGATEVPVDD